MSSAAPNSNGHLTPSQLVRKYPEIELWGWNQSKIGIFYHSRLLVGKPKLFKSMIEVSSFLELVDYANTLHSKDQLNLRLLHGQHVNHMTPEEIMEEYPEIGRKWNWTASKIGTFYSAKLLLGHRNGKENKALIVERSFQELVEYVNGIQEKMKLKL